MMKVLQSKQQMNNKHDEGVVNKPRPWPIILGYCLKLCEIITYLSIWILFEKKWQKHYPSPFSNRGGGWDRILGSQCLCYIKLF